MLKRIQIEQLYNQYNYDIELNGNGEGPRFITGPNGYGKSTLLNIIDYVYHTRFEELKKIPFTKLLLDFEVETAMGSRTKRLSVVRSAEAGDGDRLRINFIDMPEGTIGTSFTVPGKLSIGMDLFFSVDQFYYIRDQRLQRKEKMGDKVVSYSALKDNTHHFKRILDEMSQQMAADLLITDLQFEETISQDEYEAEIQKIDQYLQPVYRYGLIAQRQYPKYDAANALFLKAYVEVLNHAVAKYEEDIRLLTTFEDIVNSYGFSDKCFEIHKDFGFRFVSTNSLRTPLDNDELSSGERQIMIQVFELLFCAEQDSFVLVDEPEISNHYAWQLLYLQNISRIAQLKNLQCLVATHSPLIFNGEYQRTVDLYEQHEQNIQIA